jgi:hypothetical protein
VLGDQRLPADPATLGKLRYAEAVVNEVLRIQPVVPFLVMQPVRDMTLTTAGGSELTLAEGDPVFVLTTYGARRFPDADRFARNGGSRASGMRCRRRRCRSPRSAAVPASAPAATWP